MVDIERNMGQQPIVAIMEKHNLLTRDLVAASTEMITHKMVSRACKGRRLTVNVQNKVLNALKKASKKEYLLTDLFNYQGL